MGKRILVVGNGAREHAIVKKLVSNNHTVFTFMNKKNPGIAQLSKGFIISDLNDFDKIKKFKKIDLAFIGPEAPLANGIVDYMNDKIGIPAIGPRRLPAKLEWSKIFARELLETKGIQGNPRFKVCKNEEDVNSFLSEEGENVVVKPDVLTGGKGVKVFGVHLNNKKEIKEYANKRIKNDGLVLLEQKLNGQEFTLQTFVDGKHVKLMPLVRDFKRAYDGDKGPNTGSMGSFSCKNHDLPDIPISATISGQKIIKKTINSLAKEIGQYKGILYGQFMYTGEGVKMIEYNSRFGDPEAMNVLSLLISDLSRIGEQIVDGNLSTPKFEKKATCCVYLVPEGYPENPIADQPLSINTDPSADLYYAAVYKKDNTIYTTRSRAIAILAKGDSVAEARDAAYEEVPKIKGSIRYRKDIASNV
ncbi:MAG: phosphoribosylamine--glycine ligase [Candidatus Ranarchaeia archaeon]